ncbi:MAG: Penicillin-Binding Protein C-terminus Family [Moraxellaceae bacterium]|jgi:hypothetical protein|nr:Penicillin-Binding Protein C-terminus Family [Moraxellaceae bacterium]
MMPRHCLLLLALLLPTVPASADIYKYYDGDGNLVLSDAVPKENTEQVERVRTKSVMTIPALAPDKGRPLPPKVAPVAKPAQGQYAIVIQNPVAGETYLRTSDPVPVAVSVSPGLAAGHRLEMRLDGQGSGELTRIVPDQLDRGNHTLSVQVVDAAGRVLTSAEVAFHVQQRSMLGPNAPKPAAGKK